MQLTLLDNHLSFPDPNSALREPNGMLAIGGDLSVNRLLLAYQQGIFPWFSDGEPIIWWSPDPRAVLDPQNFHSSHSFKRFVRKTNYRVTINHDFDSVINLCALTHGDTWITAEIIAAYCQLHQLGFAHSIEVWHNRQLIGGLYGVTQGALFCGESMFSLKTNASKMALYAFNQHFIACGGQLIDCQVLNSHTASLGAIEISRNSYLTKLKLFQQQDVTADCWSKQELN